MVYTEHALRWQQFHVAPAVQQPISAVSMLRNWYLNKHAVKKETVTHLESLVKWAQRVCWRAEKKDTV